MENSSEFAAKETDASASAHAARIEQQLSGHQLSGDDLPCADIERWNQRTNAVRHSAPHQYHYAALDRFHAVGGLLRRRYDCCLSWNCGAGESLLPLSTVTERFVAVEPLEQYWRDEIGGRPAQYLKPSVLGELALETDSVDLALLFDALHHIANVSHVLGELARVLRPGGLLVVRDPISWMGDWRQPRRGLTANERGLPLAWFEDASQAAGFQILRRRLCLLTPLSRAWRKLGLARPLERRPLILLDWLCSEGLRWNVRYRRQGLLAKFAPSSALWLLRKPAP